MTPATYTAELDRRQRVIDDLREQLAAADAEVKRLRAHLDWWRKQARDLRIAWWNSTLTTPEPDDAIAGWDEANLGGTA